jgi:microtubule-associated protein-like 6
MARPEYEGRVLIKLHSGSNIADLDPDKSGSDPYVVFILGDEEEKSITVANNSNPVWDDEFSMGVVDRRYILRCLLYDKDENGEEDDFLGYAEVSLEDLKEDEETPFELELQRATSGSLKISLTIDMEQPQDEEDFSEEDDDIPMIVEEEPKVLESMAVKAWKGAIVPPDGEEQVRSQPWPEPTAHLELEWAHGFRGHDTRQCAVYNKHGNMVWITAAIGVVYDKATQTQRFFMGHEQDILCMAISPADGVTVATGQSTGNKSHRQKPDPKIMVWNSEDCSTLAELTGAHARGIQALAFSPSGKKLASVGMDDQNSVVVWDWGAGKPVGPSVKSGGSPVLMVSFDRVNDNSFFSVGPKSNYAWTLSPGGKISKKSASFGRKFKSQTMLAVAPHRGGFITGAYQGELYGWTGTSASSAKPGHQGAVYALHTTEKNVVSGGKDGAVVLRDLSLKPIETFNVEENVRSVFLHGNNIIVGTYEGSIMEIDIPSKQIHRIMTAHGGMKESGNQYSGETWGLDTHPDGQHYASVSDDRTVRVYNSADHRCVGRFDELSHRGRACSWHPDGTKLAVACKDGMLFIFEWDAASGNLHLAGNFQKRDFRTLSQFPRNGGIDELRFSPDGTMLATGCHSEGKGGSGGIVDIFQVSDSYPWTRIRECKGHTSFIRHLDWTEDSKSIRSTDGNPELLFWDAKSGNQHRNGASLLKNESWHSMSSEIGWPVQGVIRKLPGYVQEMNMTDLNMCDVSPDRELLVSGDDFGNVTLYRYPCTNKKDGALFFTGHSSFVQNVKFSKDGKHVYSAGGHDKTIMQWRVVA